MTHTYDHKDQVALIVASGPSSGMITQQYLEKFREHYKEQGTVIIGTNNVWNVASGSPLFADYGVILDRDFLAKNQGPMNTYRKLNPAFIPVLGFKPRNDVLGKWHQINILTDRTAEFEPAYEFGQYFHGLSSGVAAIQFALHCGVSKILLIGHDLCCHEGKTHGNGKRNNIELDKNYPQGRDMMIGYMWVYEQAKSLGVDVLNLSPISELNFIPKPVNAE